jgi:four helix bundle protein
MEKKYDLEERTFQFAKEVCLYCKSVKKNVENIEYIKQVIRSSASIGANYIEMNEALSSKDTLYRAKISRKEAKETKMWLRLLFETEKMENEKLSKLIIESDELRKILSSIINKLQ